MDKGFSWYTIEIKNGEARLYFHNKKGIRRCEARSNDLSYIEFVLSKRLALKESIEVALVGAIQKLKTDPEALKRLQNRSRDG